MIFSFLIAKWNIIITDGIKLKFNFNDADI